ncbi:hypothetical protein FRC20_004835 [Serendipita sp. 405]|nr:hypothetical protein FRC20_004835 [Serendipita sp. 405]
MMASNNGFEPDRLTTPKPSTLHHSRSHSENTISHSFNWYNPQDISHRGEGVPKSHRQMYSNGILKPDIHLYVSYDDPHYAPNPLVHNRPANMRDYRDVSQSYIPQELLTPSYIPAYDASPSTRSELLLPESYSPSLSDDGSFFSGVATPSGHAASWTPSMVPSCDILDPLSTNSMYSLSPKSHSPCSSTSSARSSSSLKSAPVRSRARNTPRHLQHQYLDTILRSKFPKDRLTALNVAIQYRDDHTPTDPIPNELLDQLLEGPTQDKYYCFCCPTARKARTITPARDHVRKSLGNFPYKCSNSWCQHTALRQADLNKHSKTCSLTQEPF